MGNSSNDRSSAESAPWYLCSTITGVPRDKDDINRIDKNRSVWNRYVARALPEIIKEAIVESDWISEDDVTPISDEELFEYWTKRINNCEYNHASFPPNLAHRIGLHRLDFAHGLYFSGFLFPMSLGIGGSKISEYGGFDKCVFFNLADIQNAEFSCATTFSESKFLSVSIFSDIDFRAQANFESTAFSEIGLFDRSKFHNAAAFSHISFGGYASFTGVVFSEDAEFKNCRFRGDCDFVNVKFKSTTNFNHTVFASPPKFHGAEMHPDSIWPERDGCWPETPKDKIKAREAERAWSSLKWSMNQVQRHDSELDFFAKELEAKSITLKWPRRWVIGLYKGLSNYGRSAFRPFFWWLVTYVGAFAVNFCSFSETKNDEAAVETLTIASFTLANAFPFGRETDAIEDLGEVPRWLDFISAGHTFLSLLFIFLIGLALRNRLRIK